MKIPRMPETTVSYADGIYTIRQEYDYRVVDLILPEYALPELLARMGEAHAAATAQPKKSPDSILEL